MDKLKKINLKPIDLFLIVSLGITLLFILFNITTKGMLFKECVMDSPFLFSDYFYHLAGSTDDVNVYSYGPPYAFPPFAYLIYYLLWSFNPYRDSGGITNWQNYRSADNALVVFVIYNMLIMMILVYCVNQYFQERNTIKNEILLPTAILVSYPFMCTSIQRGNIVALVAIMLSLAWLWMSSESKVKQELALVFIAFAAGFKLYPALIGIVYIKRKEWKKAVRLIIYGTIVIFLPFIIFGGYKGAIDLYHTLRGIASYINPNKTNTVCGMVKWLGLKFNMPDSSANILGTIVNYIFLVSSLLFFFMSKRKWQEALFLNGILVSFLPSNWVYTLVYYLSTFFLFMQEYNEDMRSNEWKTNAWIIAHVIGFGMIFSVDFLMVYYKYGLITGIFTITYLLIGMNMINILYERVKLRENLLKGRMNGVEML